MVEIGGGGGRKGRFRNIKDNNYVEYKTVEM